MNKVLVTGASSFLGYHVAKRLNQAGIRPRVLELRDSHLDSLQTLDVERVDGHFEDPQAVAAACDGVDTVLHLAFKVSVAGGAAIAAEMERINVLGSRRLLETAAAKGVSRIVVTSSALAVGVNRESAPLDESADWTKNEFDLAYAKIRRQTEAESLARAKPGFAVVAVCPAFTLGPEDPVGAPANKLLEALIEKKLHFTLTVGFGCLDVRDFASAMVLAAERGSSGRRYLISGHNVTTRELLDKTAAIAGVRAPRFEPPKPLVNAVAAGVELVSAIRRTPAPITRSVLQIIGRYAWYDTTRARTELGWQPRPFEQTLADTVHWLQDRKARSNQPEKAAV